MPVPWSSVYLEKSSFLNKAALHSLLAFVCPAILSSLLGEQLLRSSKSTRKQGDHKQSQEQEENKFGDRSRTGGNSAKTEDRCDQRNN